MTVGLFFEIVLNVFDVHTDCSPARNSLKG